MRNCHSGLVLPQETDEIMGFQYKIDFYILLLDSFQIKCFGVKEIEANMVVANK
jgi:hypothetical protein